MRLVISIIFLVGLCFSAVGQTNESKQKLVDLINQAVIAKINGDYDQALLLIDSVLMVDSNHYGSNIIKSALLTKIGRFADAAESLKKAVAAGKPDIGLYVRLGMLYDKANMTSQAKAQYSKALKFYENTIIKSKPLLWQKVEYVVALTLNGDKKKSDLELHKLLQKFPNENSLTELKDKSRNEILEIRLSKYS
jgi:tetratricopeptide (TPR) repeat protein